MPVSSLLRPLIAFLLFTNVVLAGRYSFSVTDIIVRRTRDNREDDLFLAIASTAGSSTTSNNFTLVPVNAEDTIKWTNLTSEIDVPTTATNLSVALGLANIANSAENEGISASLNFVKGIVTVAGNVPGPQAPAAKLVSLALSFFSADLLNCDGPVAIGNAVYAKAELDDMDKGKKNCETRDYSYEPQTTCGFRNSSYTVTHCLERLDDKAAANVAMKGYPALGLAAAGLVVTMGFGLFM